MVSDILLDENNDLRIEEGDFVVNSGDAQICDLLLNTSPGDWRDAPTMGVGVDRYLNGPRALVALEAELRRQLQIERLRIYRFDIENGEINIELHV